MLVAPNRPKDDIVVRGARVVDPARNLDQVLDVRVDGGTIAELGEGLDSNGHRVIEGEGLLLAPAFVDPHVHLRTPGREDEEDLVSGTRAAAAGGYCAILAMPNTDPVVDSAAVLGSLVEQARSEAEIPVGFLAAITKGQAGSELTEMVELAHAGAVGFSDDGQPVMSPGLLRRALQYSAAAGPPIALHCEEKTLTRGGHMHEGTTSAELGFGGWPSIGESVMVGRDLALARYEERPLHLLHLSARESVEELRRAQAEGVAASGEVTPHHLCATDELVRSLDSNTKMNPPLRDEDDRQALLDALRDGTIAAIATDHAPHARHEKEVPVRGGAVRRHRARDGVRGALHAPRRAGRPPAGDPARADERRSRADLRARGADDRQGRRGEPRPLRPGRRVDGRGVRLPLQVGELVASGRAAHGEDRRHRRGGKAGLLRMTGFLLLEDGTVFPGRSVGADGVALGEAVFTTAMSGYQEVVTDPSFAEQLVCFTAPMVGNYGISPARSESGGPHARAVLMRRAGGEEWTSWLAEQGVVALDEVDTRSLVLHLRERGAMRAAAVSGEVSVAAVLERVRAHPPMAGRNLVADVSTTEIYAVGYGGPRIAVLDYGCKRSIVERLLAAGASVRVLPHSTSAENVLAAGPDGVVLSNGPGDPSVLADEVATVRELLGRVPILGICLGHQLLARAAGFETFKLRFGHRGANHPVLETQTGRVLVTAQNHGFAVADGGDAVVTHFSLYDGTVEGIALPDQAARSVQFHPEASPGPHDARAFLSDWVKELGLAQAA